MTCACPKCEATLSVDVQGISIAGTSLQCPECRSKIWTQREEFSRRAYKKAGRIHCASCGNELGYEDICLHCGILCPEYFVVQTTKPAPRKQQKQAFHWHFKPINLNRKESLAPLNVDVNIEPERRANLKPLAYVALAVLVLVLIGGLGKYYLHLQAHREYSKQFVVALFGIKTGTDLSLQHSHTILSSWHTTGQATAPRLSQKELDHLDAVKGEIDKALATLTETPDEYAESRKKLTALYQAYLKIKALNVNPPASMDQLDESTQKLEKDFLVRARALRSSMPENLLNELQTSAAKYRNLRFLMEKA